MWAFSFAVKWEIEKAELCDAFSLKFDSVAGYGNTLESLGRRGEHPAALTTLKPEDLPSSSYLRHFPGAHVVDNGKAYEHVKLRISCSLLSMVHACGHEGSGVATAAGTSLQDDIALQRKAQ